MRPLGHHDSLAGVCLSHSSEDSGHLSPAIHAPAGPVGPVAPGGPSKASLGLGFLAMRRRCLSQNGDRHLAQVIGGFSAVLCQAKPQRSQTKRHAVILMRFFMTDAPMR